LVVLAMFGFLACQHLLLPFLPTGEATALAAGPAVTPAEDEKKVVVCYGYADLEGGVTTLHPTQSGRVEEILVKENDTVPAGGVLVRLDDRAARLRVEEAKAVLEEATARLAKAEKAPEQHRLKIQVQQAALEMARHRLAAAQHTLAGRQEQLKEERIGRVLDSPVTVELVASTAQRVKEFEEVARAEQFKLADLELQDPRVELQRVQAEVAAMRARWLQAEEVLKEHTLRAPVAGQVLRIFVAPGELISAQPKRMAVQFCPDQPRFVRAEVDQAFAQRVKIGQPAVVEDDSSFGTSWRGRVMRLSDWYTQRREIAEEQLQLKDVRTLECLIVLDPGQPPLRIGQRVRATIRRADP
jgi:multidrug resistance efflux pump